MNSIEVLREAEKIARKQEIGVPEENFAGIADMWGAYLDKEITSVDVAMMMALLKIVRIKAGTTTDDSFIDLACYSAYAGEIAGWLRD